jgi:hypothetical protein
VDKKLGHAFIEQQGIFNGQQVNRLVQKLNSKNPGDAAVTVWILLNFQSTWQHIFNA